MTDLAKFLDARLRIADAKRHTDSDSPPWWEDGVTIEIDEATYFWFLDQLAPRYMSGDLFAFGKGAGSFKLFWVVDRRHFAHQLSLEDTDEFCRLTRVALHQKRGSHVTKPKFTDGNGQLILDAINQLTEELNVLRIVIDEMRDEMQWKNQNPQGELFR